MIYVPKEVYSYCFCFAFVELRDHLYPNLNTENYGGPQGSLRIISQHISNYYVRISNYAQHIPNSSKHIFNSLQILKSSQHISKSPQHISKSSQHISKSSQHIRPRTPSVGREKGTVTQLLLLPSTPCFVPRVESLCNFCSNFVL